MTDRRSTAPPRGPAEDTRGPVARRTRTFGVLLLASLWLGLLTVAWPWPLLVGVLSVVAVVVGVRALAAALRARRPVVAVLLVVGLLLALLQVLGAATQAVFWAEFSAYDACRRAAVTVQAQRACDAALQRDLGERVPGMEQLQLGP